MNDFQSLPSQEIIDRTIEALQKNGFNPVFVQTKEEAKQKVLELVPKGAEVYPVTSITSETLGLPEIFNTDEYDSLRVKIDKLDRTTQGRDIRKMGSAPDYVVGSVHAVTTDGRVLIASRTGSQLPAYVYGAGKVIWVVGAQKIVADITEGMKRIQEYVVPLESVRANKAYNITSGSKIDKLVTYFEEEVPERITLILVNQQLGF